MMEVMHSLRVHIEEAGLSAFEFLRARIPAAPPAFLRQILRRGKVMVGDRPANEHSPLEAGETVDLPRSQRLQEFLTAKSPPAVEILHEDSTTLAVFKPSGLAVHRGVGHEEDNLVRRVEALLKSRKAPYRAAPAHRLDVGTSGPVLFAKGRRAAALLGALFQGDQVEKTYLALASGSLPETGRLTGGVPAKGKFKEASALYRRLAEGESLTLLEVRLLTGRTHQIRRQLADAGHPLAGDARYGGILLPGLAHPFLHCRRLALPSPEGGQRLELDVPLPDALVRLLEDLGLSWPPSGDQGSANKSAC